MGGRNKIRVESADILFHRISSQDDEKAFRALFYDYFAPLCVFAHRYIEEMDSCEDIVQEVFFRVWKNRKELFIETSARNFLVTSVRNACLDFLRKKDVEKRWMENSLENEEAFCYDLYTTVELERLLNEALDKLPEPIASTFRMNRFEGKTYAEIAEAKQLSVKTVEAYMQ